MERLDSYRFIANPGRERLIAVQTAKMLLTKMFQNIEERERNGIDQKATRIMLQTLAAKNTDESNIMVKKAEKIYKELLVEANA